MYGMNKNITLLRTERPISDTGSVSAEIEVPVITNVRASIQSHVLNNLPPPGDRNTAAGLYYLREFRCWIPRASIPGITPRTQWIVQDEDTLEKFRIRAVVDDGGRAHHWLFRMEAYDG